MMVHLSKNSRRSSTAFLTTVSVGVLVALLFGESLLLIPPAFADPAIVLTPKWTRTGLGTNWEGGLVIGDVTGDGQEDVVYAGGSTDTLYVLNGNNGNTIATYVNSRIGGNPGSYSQPQLYDVDNDGIFEIIVPMFYLPSLACVEYDGDSTLRELWVTNVQGTSGSGSIMSKPVAGDTNHDGWLEIYQASQDVGVVGGYDGTVTMLDHLGNILHQTFTWRACSGGLSLADTDSDGTFELYQGDRQEGYTDGGYGKGTRSFWADNLTERWNRIDFLSSSQAPVLADVNNDGILDVLAGMYREMNILNSANGEMIQRWSDDTMSVHYGFTVYDIDGDGHLELLCNDGDHDNDPYTDVYDLVTGQLEAELSLAGGDWKWGPLIADVSSSHPGMEIIVCPNGTSIDNPTLNKNYAAIMIYDSSYHSIQNVTRNSLNGRLISQVGYPFVQDIDSDGLLELVTESSSGIIYAYDTSAPAPGHSSALPGSERIRSEVTYFGERRLGVAEHTILPWEEDYWTAPLVAPVSPGDNALAVPVSTTQLRFKLREHQSESLTYSVTTSPNIGSRIGSISSGTYNWNTLTVNVNGLVYDTTYRWTVTASDGLDSTVRTYTFRTEQAPNIGNHAPTQGTPSLASQDGLNTTSSTFVCSNESTADLDGDQVTNIYRWQVNGAPVANLLLPFDTRNETMTKDYSGYGNNGVVTGAAWTENGIVGGAYSFDGKDDAIIVSDGGAGYFNDRSYTTNNPELGGDGTWQGITVEAWIYLTAYNNGSRIVAKIPSYELGFVSGYTNRLQASVWPAMGQTATDANGASTDQIQTVTATVDIQLNTWYHIAFTYKNGTGLQLYLNGALVASRTTNKGPIKRSLGEPLYIGRLVQPFEGSIDEVRIYPYAQPAEQIQNRYQETKDGLSSSSLFRPGGMYAPGSSLSCQVIPTDSFVDGTPASTRSVTLINSPPTASNLNVYPLRSRTLRLDGENLNANYVYQDIDSNPEQNSEIRWYSNGVLQSGFNNQLQIPAGSTVAGQKWCFTVRPRDSLSSFGDIQTSYNVTIYANALPTTGTPELASSAGTNLDDEDLIAGAQGSTDSNGDSVTNIYHWTLEGTSLTNLQMPFDTETPLYLDSNSTTRDYSGYGNDGTVVGATWAEDGVVGGAYNFDGNDYIRINEHSNSLGGSGTWSEVSIEFWVKASADTSTRRLILKHNADFSTSSSNPYGVSYRVDVRGRSTSTDFTWYIYRATGYNSTAYSITTNPRDWHHVVCTYRSGVGLRIYVDGTPGPLVPATGNINATLNGPLDISYGGSTNFKGMLDEVRIYPRELTAAQIFQRFVETRDGVSSGNTIVAQQTTAGDDWVCQVIPNDSWEDGTTRNSPGLHVYAVVGNSRPRIDWYSPANATPVVDEGSSLAFSQFSSDPNGTPLSYAWRLDSSIEATTQNWTYSPVHPSAGSHIVTLTVSDGSLTDSQEWYVTVNGAGVPQYTLTVNVIGSGSVTKNPNLATYANGTVVTLTATPNSGWSFSAWSDDASGSVSPTTVTMTGNKLVTAIFTQNQYTLTVVVVGHGSVTKNPDLATYTYGSVVTLTAVPDLGWAFLGWSGDASGSSLTTTVTMTGSKVVTATFTDQYILTIDIVGNGLVTKDPDQVTYAYNTVVTLTATPGIGWSFVGWSGDASGTGLTTTVTMTGNKAVTATFTSPILFSDGFESGSFSAWTGTSVTGGEATTVVTNPIRSGTYSARFTSNGRSKTERAYAYRSITSSNELYVRGYFYVSQSGIADNGDRFSFMTLLTGSTSLAYVGWARTDGAVKWTLMIKSGRSSVIAYSTASPSINTWYSVELHWKRDSTNGLGELYVDGVLVVSMTNRNTASYSGVNTVRFGLPEIYRCASTTTVTDNCIISSVYIGPSLVLDQQAFEIGMTSITQTTETDFGALQTSNNVMTTESSDIEVDSAEE